mgnify:CR=1 FL=1
MKEDQKSNVDVPYEPHFSKVEIRCMSDAVDQNDFETFKQIYEDRKPDDGLQRIKEYYQWMQEKKNHTRI